VPRISVSLLLKPGLEARHELLHNLDIDLLHVDFLIELWRELCRPQQFRIHAGRHGGCALALCRASRMNVVLIDVCASEKLSSEAEMRSQARRWRPEKRRPHHQIVAFHQMLLLVPCTIQRIHGLLSFSLWLQQHNPTPQASTIVHSALLLPFSGSMIELSHSESTAL
jgi:hypothetical protein